ncbi:uncharacterized protein WCC33_018603, partial [Rhinophrynus dorsalis]
MEFPSPLFPDYYSEGPCTKEIPDFPSTYGWGELNRVQLEKGTHSEDMQWHRFIPLYSRSAERWTPSEAAPVPLLPPNSDGGLPWVVESDLIRKRKVLPQRRNTSLRNTKVTVDFSKQ